MAKIPDGAEVQILLRPVERLEPSSEWRGRLMADTDIFGLEEAARFASSHAGVTVSSGDILRAAARGQIRLHAILREQKSFCLVGKNQSRDPDVNCAPHCLLPLTLDACAGLSLGALEVYWRDYERITKLEDGAVWIWLYARVVAHHTEIRTVRDDCAVDGRAVHALADHIRGRVLIDAIKKEQSQGAPPSIHVETRVALSTCEAAYHLNRSQQTLRIWACKGTGPIKPVRINGRLAWPVADIRRLLETPQ